jgi:hypothetical protein
MGQICLGPAFRAGNSRVIGQMLNFHQQPHVRKPANVAFVPFSAAAELFGCNIVMLFIHSFHL